MAPFLRRSLARFLEPLFEALVRVTPVDDPWDRLPVDPGLEHYGSGARHEFEWYFAGESTVPVSNMDHVLDWLLGCDYVRDPELFREPDYWQHPQTFEQLRRGDCEDFALWAWRKLVEMGYDADLVVGYCAPPGATFGRHAWVMYRHAGVEYVVEAARREREKIVRPLTEVRERYVPEFGVGPDRRRFAFSGYLYVRKYPERIRGGPEARWGEPVAVDIA